VNRLLQTKELQTVNKQSPNSLSNATNQSTEVMPYRRCQLRCMGKPVKTTHTQTDYRHKKSKCLLMSRIGHTWVVWLSSNVLAISRCVHEMSISKSWGINRHTMQANVSMVYKLVSSSGLWNISPCGYGEDFNFYF